MASFGSTVQYNCGVNEEYNGSKQHPAIITRVWEDDRLVNLCVLRDGASPMMMTSVRHKAYAHPESNSWEDLA